MTESWTLTKLSEILQPVLRPERVDPTKELRLLGIRLDGAGPFHRETIQGSQSAATTLYQVKSGDFIYSRLFACRGAFGIIDSNLDGCYVSGEFPTFVPINDRVDINFLRLWFRLPMTIRKVESDCTGSTPLTRNRFKENFFLNLEIFLPPLAEQHRIVAKINELAAKAEEALTLRQQTTENTDALLDLVVGATFTKLNQAKHEALGALTTKIGSGSTPLGGRANYPSSGVPFIRSLNVRMRQFKWEGITFIDRETHERMNGTQVRPNDVLLNITGASIGRVACAPANLIEANVNQHVSIIRPVSELDSRYLMYWLSQPSIQKFINNEQKGATRQGFTKAQIERFHVPVLPIFEQKRIVAELDSLQARVEALRRIQAETNTELEALLPSILDKAFKGELLYGQKDTLIRKTQGRS